MIPFFAAASLKAYSFDVLVWAIILAIIAPFLITLIKRRDVFTKRSVALSALVALSSATAMAISGIMGGDLYDGVAGGSQENTSLESTLMYGGLLVMAAGLLSFMITFILAWVDKKPSSK
jgi:hypothetical protein